MLTKHRIEYLDIVKGVGIVLIILGHNPMPRVCSDWIFSFHVPLFFILSGYFYKNRTLLQTFIKGIRQLVIPFYVANFICSFICRDISNSSIITILYDTIFVYRSGQNMGLWFLLALFWGKIILCLIYKYSDIVKILISVILFCLITYIANSVTDVTVLPFRLYFGFISPAFMIVGLYFHRLNSFESVNFSCLNFFVVFLLLMFAWIVPIEVYLFNFPLGIINIVTSSILAFCLIFICKCICSIDYILISSFKVFFRWSGRFSLIFLCIHSIESTLQIEHFLSPYMTACAIGPIKVLLIAFCTFVLTRIQFVLYLFGYK